MGLNVVVGGVVGDIGVVVVVVALCGHIRAYLVLHFA